MVHLNGFVLLLWLALSLVCCNLRAGFVFTGFGPAQWGASDSALGISGFAIEDFEDLNLVSGLTVSWQSAAGNRAASNVLPNLFNPVTDDSNGTLFTTPQSGVWDGTRGLLNTRDNASHPYGAAENWGDITFAFATPAQSVGFSVQQMNVEARLIIDGTDVGGLTTLAGFTPDGSRQGYIRIDTTGGTTISTITIDNGAVPNAFSDGIMIDHLAISAVPEPGSLLLLLTAAIPFGLRKRRSAKR